MSIFVNRRDAGKKLAKALSSIVKEKNIIVVALPRGGVPVAYEIANSLAAPLEVCIVRKLGVPGHEELAMGSVAGEGVVFLDHDLIKRLQITQENVKKIVHKEMIELERRNKIYRKGQDFPSLLGKTVILVDDGLATGFTMLAAIEYLKRQKANKIIVAVPVGPTDICTSLKLENSEVVCLNTPTPFYAVGQAYLNFEQTLDKEVLELLDNINNKQIW